jgi:hypothetical protein
MDTPAAETVFKIDDGILIIPQQIQLYFRNFVDLILQIKMQKIAVGLQNVGL